MRPTTARAATTRASGPSPAATARPLRADAERNRQRIMRAAAAVFAERGLQASLDEVARRAGVGVGTVYRRFPTKEAIAGAVLAERVDALATLAEHASAEPDAWTGQASFLEKAGAEITADRALRQVCTYQISRRDWADHARARMQLALTKLIECAQQAGALRTDLRPTDIPLIEIMLGAVAAYTHPAQLHSWRRCLLLILDGLRQSRVGTTALPEPSLSPAASQKATRPGR